MLTPDQLRNRLSYLEEETLLDAEVRKPEFKPLDELVQALNAADAERHPSPATRQRVEKAFKAAQAVVSPAMRARAGKSYIAFLMTLAEQFLSSTRH